MNKKITDFLIPIAVLTATLAYIYTKKEKGSGIKQEHKGKEDNRIQIDNSKSISENSMDKLNDRQREILKLFKRRSVLIPTDIYSVAPNVSTRTLRRDMTKLVDMGLVIQDGSTKDTRYILKQ